MPTDSRLTQLLDDIAQCVARVQERSVPAVREELSAVGPSPWEQLEWVVDNWFEWLPVPLRDRVLLAKDERAEAHQFRGGGPGPAESPSLEGEGEAYFSDDRDWMANTVLMAKQAYVWLHQLGVSRLDEIPDTALDELAGRGFTGLWLIGLWERSPASRNIKRRRGNPQAESSAYALSDYAVAERLGGSAALDELRARAHSRGIRLAADMVPNHMGMDSRWMAENPDWFLQLSDPPYPSYTFDGPDVSGDPRIGVFLEDGYWTETDAAVVFKCVDHTSGRERFVYHGNDGTQMPWNDTAQLDYLQPDVREAVIQTIIDVARRFPIIRFDAAMTLARRHIERLWYPPPGAGGAIPSRAANSVSAEVFAEQVPNEFWREVVDRVRDEVPDTLLLAEAFWMMEGYFVRHLGMHRVYNSAFMHMLRDEDNAKYRQSIKDVLAYSPAILERYVNFMNNPDEDTAVDQFGKGDKYFGIATVLATLPGLPMFGHGQIEGFAEKYGMEFSRSYDDEEPDAGFIAYHVEKIFPLLRARHRFSGVAEFALFDVTEDGEVREDVYAYTNGDALVLYNNAATPASGWISESAPVNTGTADAPKLETTTLPEPLFVELGPYESRVRLP